MPIDDFIVTAKRWKHEAQELRREYDDQWSKNIRNIRGVFDAGEVSKSKVRGRSKLFYRKIWAISWRILASFYQIFLRDPDNFKIVGRDADKDNVRSKILHFIVKWRYDMMMRVDSLFIQFMWAFQDIINLGFCVGKFRWVLNEHEDKPEFILYPPEQVYHDMTTAIKEKKKYIMFENWSTKDELMQLGYEESLIDDLEPMTPETNLVRQTRFQNEKDPLQNPQENEYPQAGKFTGADKNEIVKPEDRYVWYEVFYKEDGKCFFASYSNEKIMREPEESVYGRRYPVVLGQCLTLAHKAMGEGFPEPLEGVQESMNAHLNQRKDNVSLALNGRTIVSRFANVDLQSLTRSRAGGVTLADDVAGVVDRPFNNVTQTAYAEAAADDVMMQEMSGVTPSKEGRGEETKATVAQINLAESNAKIDLFAAMVKETFLMDFFSTLANLIQQFETNETILRVANENFRDVNPTGIDMFDLGNEVDLELNVGLGAVGRQMEIQQAMLAMDRANMSNQAMAGLLQSGAVPQQDVRMIDTTKFMEEILPKLGFKDVQNFFFAVAPPPPQQEAGGLNPALAGAGQPNIGLEGGRQAGQLQ
ncbi:MAG: hypothetical protein CMD96_08210 [Gammaproteobacteria bacterium]|nr:hypothetical protein [Gammaproteobacteria bacterium]|tara:strand:+ start:2369 stop:4135 length:1767 start_codon:yes stop_codon:yes gene_type:complete